MVGGKECEDPQFSTPTLQGVAPSSALHVRTHTHTHNTNTQEKERESFKK